MTFADLRPWTWTNCQHYFSLHSSIVDIAAKVLKSRASNKSLATAAKVKFHFRGVNSLARASYDANVNVLLYQNSCQKKETGDGDTGDGDYRCVVGRVVAGLFQQLHAGHLWRKSNDWGYGSVGWRYTTIYTQLFPKTPSQKIFSRSNNSSVFYTQLQTLYTQRSWVYTF